MKYFTKTTCIFILIFLFPVLWFAINIFFGESYFFLKPDIDTVFAEKFDEKKFNSIVAGQDSSSVVDLIGDPIYIQKLDDTTNLWYYTNDGKCVLFDFAWLGREIYFSKDNKVVRLSRPIHYD
jgi:hypothetical protein